MSGEHPHCRVKKNNRSFVPQNCQVVSPVPRSFLWYSQQIYPLVIWHSYGKSSCWMGNSTISMAIFNSYMLVYQRVKSWSHLVMQKWPPEPLSWRCGKSLATCQGQWRGSLDRQHGRLHDHVDHPRWDPRRFLEKQRKYVVIIFFATAEYCKYLETVYIYMYINCYHDISDHHNTTLLTANEDPTWIFC